MLERFQNVGVSGGIATKHQADQGDRQSQVGKINSAPKRVGGLAKVEHDQPCAGLGYTDHFINSTLPARQIPQSVANGNDIEIIVRKLDLLGVALKEARLRGVGSGWLQTISRPSDGQHFRAEIEAGRFGTPLGQGKGKIAGTAA